MTLSGSTRPLRPITAEARTDARHYLKATYDFPIAVSRSGVRRNYRTVSFGIAWDGQSGETACALITITATSATRFRAKITAIADPCDV